LLVFVGLIIIDFCDPGDYSIVMISHKDDYSIEMIIVLWNNYQDLNL
jgi:hypothetical protein